ncbi:MAG: hypothetical protein LUO93_08170 [Methanomicrobiales archaeon]|nr:hypothetical protein [Methanomicrobiales archaeon]
MNGKNISGITCAGINSGTVSYSNGAAYRELYSAFCTKLISIVYKGVNVLNFVLAVAKNWDSGTIISREKPILPISIILGKRWAQIQINTLG